MSLEIEELADRLSHLLAAQPQQVEAEWTARPAAVLIPLYYHRRKWSVLFTTRTDAVEAHRGQVSFPGGQIEPQDSGAAEAALRETEEEIGLKPADVRVLGQLNPLMTVTQFLISPVVGVIPWPYPLEINEIEVAKAFGVPLQWLADPANLEMRMRQPLVPGPEVPVYYYKPYGGEIIWGATARILLSLLELLGLREAE